MDNLNHLLQFNLNLLVSLKALLEMCNVTNAADKVNITQSTMSRNLAQLRDIFDDPLLVRSGNKYVRTPKANMLQKQVTVLLSDVSAIFNNNGYDPTREARDFIIAAPDYPSIYVLPDALAPLYTMETLVNFRLIPWDGRSKRMLISGDVHLAVSLADKFPPYIYRQRVDLDHMIFVVRKGHPLADKETWTPEDFVAYPHGLVTSGGNKYRFVDQALRALGLKRTIKLRSPSYTAVTAAVRKSDLVCVVPCHVFRHACPGEDIVAKPLPFEHEPVEHSVWWHERYHFDSAHQWLRSEILSRIMTHPCHLGLSGEKCVVGGGGEPDAAG